MYPKSYIDKIKSAKDYLKTEEPLSLDELFKLFKSSKKYENKNDLQILSNLRIASSNACCNSYLQKQSIWEIFLIAYMYENFKKEYHSGKGQWI